jgi:hypothetical protein
VDGLEICDGNCYLRHDGRVGSLVQVRGAARQVGSCEYIDDPATTARHSLLHVGRLGFVARDRGTWWKCKLNVAAAGSRRHRQVSHRTGSMIT